MKRKSDVSCKAYRQLVKYDERFVPYFRTATPEQELGGLNVGSRPAKRNPRGGVESLRAIPWNFSWTQTRLNLPTWLGVGEALDMELKLNRDHLRDMQSNWPWFTTLIDLLELICVKSEPRISKNYDDQLVNDAISRELGSTLRNKFHSTKDAVLKTSGNAKLQQHNVVLMRSLQVRNPYVDPLNLIQAEILRRLREADEQKCSSEEKRLMQDTLLITINGIANGMRNSG
jgi:phosphoenolpyruvate carboxylase